MFFKAYFFYSCFPIGFVISNTFGRHVVTLVFRDNSSVANNTNLNEM